MKKVTSFSIVLLLLSLLGCNQDNKSKESSAENTDSAKEGILVTADTYIRAESDREFHLIQQQAGGINKFFHFREVTPIDQQSVVRMNKDVLYSMAVVDTKGGATITFPEMPDDRYASIYLVDNDHYVPFVIYEPGVHKLPEDTRYLGIGIRIQLYNQNDSKEVEMVNRLQDQFVIKASSSEPVEFKWNKESLEALTKEYNAEFAKFDKYPSDWQGKRGEVNEKTRHLAAAGAWGLFPEKDATYINYNGGNLSGDKVYMATYTVPEHRGFWSITVYGEDGYMKNTNNVLNASNVVFNDDKTFTVYFGKKEKCPEDAKNRLDITDGWNFLMRVYLPGESVLNGDYILPSVKEVK